MRIGVLSDTHGDLHETAQAVRVFESLGAELLIHCGDIGSLDVLSALAAWPVHFVLGNVDRGMRLAGAAVPAGHVCHDRFGTLTLEGKAVAFLHGDDETRLREATGCRQWDMVCCGHTHSPASRYVGGTLVLNPGAVTRAHQRSVAIVDLPSLDVTHVPLA
ncbi:MAG: YfcE family phosphodiesterase [Pirellulaceae bacterium]|nr:YfcE family phosphodiesterase [Pirellulaceae bacterium]